MMLEFAKDTPINILAGDETSRMSLIKFSINDQEVTLRSIEVQIFVKTET